MIKVIAVENIISGSNVRNEKDSDLLELAKSIEENGLLQPICVRKLSNGKYEIISGHRRYEAVKMNNEPFIECNIMEGVSDKERLILQVVENTQRKNMSAYELVNTFELMIEKYHCTKKQIAIYFNKPAQWVYDQYNAVDILEREYKNGIPEEKKKLSAGIIKATLSAKRKGNNEVIECNGMNVRKHGHSYIINCTQFEAEQKSNEFISAYKM